MDGDILHILNDTQFGQKLRGYDPLEVDEVLDAAIEEIKTLREQAKAATDRATRAEEQIESELGPARQNRLEAEEGLAVAKEEALSCVENAKKEAENLVLETEREVRQAVEEGRVKMLAEMAALDSDRQCMVDDMSIMEKHIEAHRKRLRSALMDLETLVGGIEARPEQAPAPSSAVIDEEPPADSKPLPQVEEELVAPEEVVVEKIVEVLEEQPTPEPPAKERREPVISATPEVAVEEKTQVEVSPVVEEEIEEPLEEPEGAPSENAEKEEEEYPATEVVAATPPPTELLDELRQSVGGDGEAMDAFFDDDEPPSSLFRRG